MALDGFGFKWRLGLAVTHINEVTLRRVRLVLGWVTVSGLNSRCRILISVCDQPPRSTQPGHPFVGMRNGHQTQVKVNKVKVNVDLYSAYGAQVTSEGRDATWLGRKGMAWFVCGWQVRLCDLLVTHGTYLSALEVKCL